MTSVKRFDINSKENLEEFVQVIIEEWKINQSVTVEWSIGKKRTNTQNNALQVYCRELAEAFSDRGLDMKRVLKKEIDIPWTQDSVREYLWKPLQKAVIQKESTTDANTNEYSKVYDVLNRHIADKYGFSVPFPSRENYENKY
tara:strand:+ start:337 stop:765 length:429 start_codon:yes stop_codon:yes gene_type:complete